MSVRVTIPVGCRNSSTTYSRCRWFTTIFSKICAAHGILSPLGIYELVFPASSLTLSRNLGSTARQYKETGFHQRKRL